MIVDVVRRLRDREAITSAEFTEIKRYGRYLYNKLNCRKNYDDVLQNFVVQILARKSFEDKFIFRQLNQSFIDAIRRTPDEVKIIGRVDRTDQDTDYGRAFC